MDNLTAMKVFVRVVESGGLSAAARVLGLAPSSVSRWISELESALGVRLLQRSNRNLSLTEAGETYFERVQELLRLVEETNLAVTEKRDVPSGLLRMTVPASVVRRHMVPAVAAFQKQYSSVRVVMSVTDRMVDIVGEGIDLAIRIGELENSSLVARKIAQGRRLVCASPGYLSAAGCPTHPRELADHDCILFRAQAGTNLWRFRHGKERLQVPVTGSFFSDDGETLVAAASQGLGIALVPEWVASEEIAAGRLTEILDDYRPQPATSPLYALYAPSPYIPPKIRSFVGFLVERFSSGYHWKASA